MAGTTTSFPGMPGPAGPTGPEGPQGPIGPTGAQGIQGETGPAGAQGPEGPQGPQGDPGATGPTGSQGTQGVQGVQGPQGLTGAAGADGDRYQTSSSTSLAINNATKTLTVETNLDYSVTQSVTIAYDISRHMHGEVVSYDDATGVLIVDVTSHSGSGTFSSWVVNLSGAVGAVGPAGPEGPQGPQGVQGEQGPQGIQGETGPAGPQGDTGPTGAQGIQGETGPAGAQGPEGPQGPIGATGPAGSTTVVGLTDRYEELPSQTFSEFAHGGLVAASPTRDIQTAIDATPVGPACQVIVGPGSYSGATVTIPAGRNNIAIIGPSAGDFGGTIASLSASRGLTIGNNVVRARIVSLQVEGLTTVSTTGSGVHRFERCQLVGGLTVGAISAYIYVVGCEVGAVTIPAGFTGLVLFDRCLFLGSITNNATAPLTRVSISDSAGGFAAPTTAATINGRWQVGTSTTFYAGGSALLGAPLTAINSLTPAADRLAYYTGASSAALATLTAFGRSLIDDVDATAARTTLGLGTAATSASTAFQSADATLTALAGLTTAADRLPYFTGVDTAAVATLTSYARTLLDDADAATARATLGLTTGVSAGNVVVLDGSARLPAVDGSQVTGVVASPYTADAWDVQWSAAAGSPATIGNYTGSANLSSVGVVGSGAFGGSAVTHEGVSCWEFTPSGTGVGELNLQPVTAVDEWELRVRIWLPSESSVSPTFLVGQVGKQIGANKPQFLCGAAGSPARGACRQDGTVKIEAGDIRASWVTLTLKATRNYSGSSFTDWAQIQFQLWLGELLVGTWNGATITSGVSSTAGVIRMGRNTGSNTSTMRIASLQWRSGNNQAPPAYTFRGRGFGGGGPA